MASPPHKRIPLALLAAVLMLFVGIWIGGHPKTLPGFLRTALIANHQTEVVDTAIKRIHRDYYRMISEKELVNSSIAGAVASLKDRFSNYLTPSEYESFGHSPHFSGIGVDVTVEHRGLRIEEVFDASPAARAGLRSGVVITAVDGRSIRGMASDKSTRLIMGSPGTDVHLTVIDHGRTRTVTVTRATITEPVVASEMRTFDRRKIGVVALSMFSEGASTEVQTAVRRLLGEGARGIVVDLRHNGGGLLSEAQRIASNFIASGVIVTTRGRTQPTITLRALGHPIAPKIPVVVLVDRQTASAAEIVTAALQDHHRAQVIGTHTFGKGVFQEVEELPNGGALDITVGEYFTPNGRNLGGGGVTEGSGISPDLPVHTGIDTEHSLNVALRALARAIR